MTVGDNNYDFTSAILESSSWFCISFPQRERCRRQQRSKSFWTTRPPSLTTRQPKKEMLLYTTVSSARGILDPTGRHPPQLGLGPPRWFQHQNTHRNRVQGAAQPLGRRRGQVVLAFNRAGCCDRGRWCWPFQFVCVCRFVSVCVSLVSVFFSTACEEPDDVTGLFSKVFFFFFPWWSLFLSLEFDVFSGSFFN